MIMFHLYMITFHLYMITFHLHMINNEYMSSLHDDIRRRIFESKPELELVYIYTKKDMNLLIFQWKNCTEGSEQCMSYTYYTHI